MCQAHECEAVMPLCLASSSTCVILAGDHLQMAQSVHSKEARALGFDRSLVERLDHVYSSSEDVHTAAPVIRLRTNYRNHADITDFLSSTLYNSQLISVSDQPPLPHLPALNFYAVNGREVQDNDSTSFYNMAEVEELARRVKELCSRWPEQWSATDILVTAAYSDQASSTSFKRCVSVMFAVREWAGM